MEENKTQGHSFMSADIKDISAALSAFQGSIEQPKLEKEVKVKTRTGGEYKFKYADLSACVKAASSVLKEHGLSVSQIINEGKLITLLSHTSGQWFKSELLLPAQSADYQSFGSAITYLKRYSYCAILGIVADTDDDANMACGNEAIIKDRANTDTQLKESISRLDQCKSKADGVNLWNELSKSNPAICTKGGVFYKAVAAKLQTLPE